MPHEVVLVMEEGHPEDGGDIQTAAAEMRWDQWGSMRPCGPFRVRRRASLLVLHFFGGGTRHVLVEEDWVAVGVG